MKLFASLIVASAFCFATALRITTVACPSFSPDFTTVSSRYVRVSVDENATPERPVTISLGSETRTLTSSNSATFDLRAAFSPGLTETGTVTVRATQLAATATAELFLLKPIIRVSGIQPGATGDQAEGWGVFVNFDLRIGNKVGQINNPNANPPVFVNPASSNLFYARYPTNTATYAQGAAGLKDAFRKVLLETGFARCAIVAHSKGTLVTRKLLQTEGNTHWGVTADQAFLAQGPHMGSFLGEYAGDRLVLGVGDYRNLAPIWPSFAAGVSSPFHIQRRVNQEALALNGLAASGNDPAWPAGTEMHLLVSGNHATTAQVSSVLGADAWINYRMAMGDDIVPLFSQLGLIWDGVTNPDLLGAMTRVPTMPANPRIFSTEGKHFDNVLGSSQGFELRGEFLALEPVVNYIWGEL